MRASCDFCFRRCSIEEGYYGYCNARTNVNGMIRDRAYGKVSAIAIDPVEKKPLYHFMPGTRTLSVAMAGCSFNCAFCQNHQIAKDNPEAGRFISPEDIVKTAIENQTPSISFTYTEPIVWQDYAADIATIAKAKGLKTIMVSNGAFSEEALERMLPLIDAYNIDLKGDASFYREYVHGDIQPVLRSIARISSYGAHIEVTTMAIEGIHTQEMMAELKDMLIDAGIDIWHITAFYPRRFMSDRNPSSAAYIRKLRDSLSGNGIRYIHTGNI